MHNCVLNSKNNAHSKQLALTGMFDNFSLGGFANLIRNYTFVFYDLYVLRENEMIAGYFKCAVKRCRSE